MTRRSPYLGDLEVLVAARPRRRVARFADRFLASSEEMPPHERALALSGSGFTLFAHRGPGPGQALLEQSLPLYRQSGDTLGWA